MHLLATRWAALALGLAACSSSSSPRGTAGGGGGQLTDLMKARNLSEAWDEGAAICAGPRAVAAAHDHGGADHHHHEDAA